MMDRCDRVNPAAAKQFAEASAKISEAFMHLSEKLGLLRVNAPGSEMVLHVDEARRHVLRGAQEIERMFSALSADIERRSTSAQQSRSESLVAWFSLTEDRKVRFSQTLKFFVDKGASEGVSLEALTESFKWFEGSGQDKLRETDRVLRRMSIVNMLVRSEDENRRPSYALSEEAKALINAKVFESAFGV